MQTKTFLNQQINNKFHLILVASRRARQIQNEEKNNLIKKNKNKCTTLALKEIGYF